MLVPQRVHAVGRGGDPRNNCRGTSRGGERRRSKTSVLPCGPIATHRQTTARQRPSRNASVATARQCIRRNRPARAGRGSPDRPRLKTAAASSGVDGPQWVNWSPRTISTTIRRRLQGWRRDARTEAGLSNCLGGDPGATRDRGPDRRTRQGRDPPHRLRPPRGRAAGSSTGKAARRCATYAPLRLRQSRRAKWLASCGFFARSALYSASEPAQHVAPTNMDDRPP
jgi:hypothetical protein